MVSSQVVFDAANVQAVVIGVSAGGTVVRVVPAKVGRVKAPVARPVVSELVVGGLQGLTLHQLFPVEIKTVEIESEAFFTNILKN